MAMGAVVYALNALPIPNLAKLEVQIVTGVAVCVVIARGARMESWEYAAGLLHGKVGRKGGDETGDEA